jgi:predicted DNA-binding ribbon-helix-helix protein
LGAGAFAGLRATHACETWRMTRSDADPNSASSPADRPAGLVKRSFTLAGHRTSVALEPEFWQALSVIADSDGQTMAALVARVDAERTLHGAPGRPLASALRVFALRHAH